MCCKQNSEISSCVSTLETAPELSKRYDRNVRNVISVTQRVRIQKTRPTHFGSKHLPDEYFIMSYFQFLILFKSRQHFTFVPKCYNTRPEIHQCHSTCTYLAWLTSVCEHTHKLTQWTVHIKRKKWNKLKRIKIRTCANRPFLRHQHPASSVKPCERRRKLAGFPTQSISFGCTLASHPQSQLEPANATLHAPHTLKVSSLLYPSRQMV